MFLLIDFSNCIEDISFSYSGSERKIALLYDNNKYMLKFAEKRSKVNDIDTSNVNNVFSENIGCEIAKSMGLEVQETLVGVYKGELVVACKNFLNENERLNEFSWYLRKQYDSSDLNRTPQWGQIINVIKTDSQLSTIITLAEDSYWDIFVLDALIGNFDRHAGNWGYVVDINTGQIKPSPIYDCGSSLFPALSELGMEKVLNNPEEILRRVYVFPNASLSVNRIKKVSYYEMLSSSCIDKCTQALHRLYDRIDINTIEEIINGKEYLSDIRKEFYVTILKARKELIIDRAFYETKDGKYNIKNFDKIWNEEDKTENSLKKELKEDEKISAQTDDKSLENRK